ncbi:hypothetical protein GCM10027570_02960 [Streptomonospora sediminis]
MSDFWSRPGSYWESEPAGSTGLGPPPGRYTAGGAAPQDPFAPVPPGQHGQQGQPGRPQPAGYGAAAQTGSFGRPGAAHPAPQPGAGAAPGGLPAPMPRFPPPSQPPARVGSAVAALLCAVLTLLFPLLFLALGFPVLTLLVNVPAIAFGIVALTRTGDPMEVERFIRYTWACTFVYLALMGVILAAAILVIMSL